MPSDVLYLETVWHDVINNGGEQWLKDQRQRFHTQPQW